jgi:hypothetical protein
MSGSVSLSVEDSYSTSSTHGGNERDRELIKEGMVVMVSLKDWSREERRIGGEGRELDSVLTLTTI